MMIHYRKKNNKKNILFFTIVIIFLAFGILGIVWPQTITRIIVVPFYKTRDFILGPVFGVDDFFRSKSSLENRIKTLEDENSKLKVSLLAQSFVNSQIDDYKKELEENQNGAILKVLNRPPFSAYDTLLVLKEDNQIEVGDKAFIKGVYIGDFESVDTYTAIIKMRSSSGYKTLVKVGDWEAEAEGQGGGQFRIKIPKDAEATSGDPVVAPELNYVLLGSVGHIEEDPIATFKTVYFSIPISFQEMDFVSVVKNQNVLE